MARTLRIKLTSHAAADKMTDKTERNDASNVLPTVDFEPTSERWIPNNLQMLRSGLFADAEIVCQGDATPRKVHRTILAGRSDWFKKAFSGDFKVGRLSTLTITTADADSTKEAEAGKVNLRETPWRVDLMLYFLYTGGIDVKDETLTSGHDMMSISIELIRLGDFYQSLDMRIHGIKLLGGHLGCILSEICPVDDNSQTAEAAFNDKTDFPQQFCDAIVNAFDGDRPVKVAQNMLADFAVAARVHLFKNKKFVSFIKRKAVPEFGSLAFTVLVTGSLSFAFDNHLEELS